MSRWNHLHATIHRWLRPCKCRTQALATSANTNPDTSKATGFLQTSLLPRPSFNDGTRPPPISIIDETGTARTVPSLRTPPSRYRRHIRYCVVEFAELLDSSSVERDGWVAIGRTVVSNYAAFDGFVVLHGTDSMAYTSSALSFMLEGLGKPVILTGSQAPMSELQNDATDNLLGSLILAAHFAIPEVCLFFNHQLLRGNRATKVSATDFAAFASPNHAPIATISSVGATVHWDLIHTPPPAAFAVSDAADAVAFLPRLHADIDTAHVACLRVFPGIKAELVAAVLRVQGLRGLVLETFGAGNAPGGPGSRLTRVLAEAVARGVVVVNVTQCLSGNVSALYASATILGRVGVVFGRDLTSEAALTKLAHLVALPGLDAAEVARRMARDLRGELTEEGLPDFRHPDMVTTLVKRGGD